MPNAFIDEEHPPKGFPDGHICDFNVELIPAKDGFKSDETRDTVFKITEASLNISEFISCSPRTGIEEGNYQRITTKQRTS